LGLIRVQQEFTHVATPEEKRAYRSLSWQSEERKSLKEWTIGNFGEIEQILKRYVIFINNTRLHGLLDALRQ